ncbi:hypothetical protein [Sphingobium sp. AP50]|uniref:hypothetical protein n=1 Tax=Sphingobium sp. AP50 TaxID=1884369 RepID=UPI000B8A404A|nr:hypothetical protein [Sphingobium sp. AP50]
MVDPTYFVLAEKLLRQFDLMIEVHSPVLAFSTASISTAAFMFGRAHYGDLLGQAGGHKFDEIA